MKNMTRWLGKGVGAALLVAFGVALVACTTPQSGSSGDVSAGAPDAVSSAMDVASGAQLWAQNCGHCHNIRSPESYSDAQWDVATLHMRIRANLTPVEQRQILAFLKSAH